MIPYLILVSGWVLYFVLHSALASVALKKRFAARPFRIFYVLFSTAGLLALLFWNGSIAAEHFFASKGPVRYLSLLLTTFGVMLIQVSFRQYSFRGFVGLSEETDQFSSNGILQTIRHPIYAGTILIVIGFFFFIPNLPTALTCLCIFIYLPIGIYLEEKKLELAFGETYREYKRRVPALLPRL